MAFSKSFPKTTKGSTYPSWEEVYLSDDEERAVEEFSKKENIELMKGCIDISKKIIQEKGLKDYQTDVVNMAISLFEKISSHVAYHKENKAKEKFDRLYKEQQKNL
ncbi:MAG: hypothetical protein HYS32_01865 [Candidatus Woesearchaeota archaeon]|nr:MAG: hypothetical protein HYS32_01865 [Candidatus Woesearchaeota archaeon]